MQTTEQIQNIETEKNNKRQGSSIMDTINANNGSTSGFGSHELPVWIAFLVFWVLVYDESY